MAGCAGELLGPADRHPGTNARSHAGRVHLLGLMAGWRICRAISIGRNLAVSGQRSARSIAARMAKPYDQSRPARDRAPFRPATTVEDLPTGRAAVAGGKLALLRDALATGRAETEQWRAGRYVVPDGPLHPRDLRFRRLKHLSGRQPQCCRTSRRGDRRLQARRAGAAQRHRSVVPYKQTPRGSRSSSSCSTCCGTWAEGRPRHPHRTSLRYGERDQTIRTALLLEARYVWATASRSTS